MATYLGALLVISCHDFILGQVTAPDCDSLNVRFILVDFAAISLFAPEGGTDPADNVSVNSRLGCWRVTRATCWSVYALSWHFGSSKQRCKKA